MHLHKKKNQEDTLKKKKNEKNETWRFWFIILQDKYGVVSLIFRRHIFLNLAPLAIAAGPFSAVVVSSLLRVATNEKVENFKNL